MSKVLNASCSSAGVVTSEGFSVEGATVLSEGKKASEGVLVIDRRNAWYLTSNASDLKDLITNMVTITEKIIEIATQLDSVTVSPGTAAANILALTTLKTQLDLTKDSLK